MADVEKNVKKRMFQSTSCAVDLEICIDLIRLFERNMVKAVFVLDQLV